MHANFPTREGLTGESVLLSPRSMPRLLTTVAMHPISLLRKSAVEVPRRDISPRHSWKSGYRLTNTDKFGVEWLGCARHSRQHLVAH